MRTDEARVLFELPSYPENIYNYLIASKPSNFSDLIDPVLR